MAAMLHSINIALFADPMIDKATTDDETPTPGYLYTDIARTRPSTLTPHAK